YLLSSTVVSPLYGKLSDIHGRRGMMLLAIGLFLAGSVVSAAAPNMTILIVGRTMQGIGGGGIVPLTQTTIADMITPRERGRYQAYMGTSWIVAGLAGPALGGAIAEYAHWSVIFWLNLPLGLLAALLTYHAMKRLPRYERPHQLDMVGAALMIVAATMFLIALTSGGTRVPWISWTIFALVTISCRGRPPRRSRCWPAAPAPRRGQARAPPRRRGRGPPSWGTPSHPPSPPRSRPRFPRPRRPSHTSRKSPQTAPPSPNHPMA